MRYIYSILFFLIIYHSKAQQTPIYSLYFKDQYAINPAAAGLKNYAIVTLNHRQQWRGIEGAPLINSISIHMPVGNKVALGGTIVNDTRGLLTSNSFDATIVYRLPLSSAIDHNIRFGFTSGIGMNSIDLSKLDNATLQDPALVNSLDSHLALRGKFGIAYNYKSFNLGFSLPTLFENNVLSQNEFDDIILDPLTNYLAYANIRVPLGNKFAFEPTVVYQNRKNGPQFEVAAIVHALDVIWLGASYRQDSGPTGLFGITISDRVDFGYAYEISSNQVSGFTNGTHEIQLSIRVGKKKDIVVKKPKKKPPIVEEPIKETLPEPIQDVIDSLNQRDNIDETIEPTVIKETLDNTLDDLKPKIVTKRGNHPFELDVGHYVVVGAFGNPANAIRANDKLLAQGYDADFGFSSEKRLFYVYILGENSAVGARKKRDELRKLPAFKNTWYLFVKE